MTTAALALQIRNCEVELIQEEGYLYDGEANYDVLRSGLFLVSTFTLRPSQSIELIRQTNIRLPILWRECYRKGVVPGTRGWDESIENLYMTNDNPIIKLLGGETLDDTIFDLMTRNAGAGHKESICLRPEIERVMRRDWPDLKRPWFRSEHVYDNPRFTDLPNNTMDQFLCRD
jgi:hypothetical protein